jgi:capsular polysaccharide transport system permease protein
VTEAVGGYGTLGRGLHTQVRVTGALVMREIITRYGRHNIGFMWMFVEPMLFTLGVVTVWTLLKTHTTRLPLIPFTVTGYSTVLLWRNTIGRCGNAIEPNRALLHHRNVRVLDLFIARLLLEIAGASISFLTLSIALTASGFMDAPDDILKMLIGWLLLAWFSMGMGLMIGSLSALSETIERVWHVFAYLFLPLSGAFYMIDWLPKHLQPLALLIPTADCTELIRAGYFGESIRTHYELGYLLALNLVLTFVSLAAVKGVSTTVEGE